MPNRMTRIPAFAGLAWFLTVVCAMAAGPDATITLDLQRVSSWSIAPQLFGSFYEEHWGDVTPGIYEQYLVNPSFEPWYTAPGENKTRVVFPVVAAAGIAYPWGPYPDARAASWSASADRVNSEQSQRIEVHD